MKESKFVEQNKKNWQDFETDLRQGQNKAKLSNLFIQITDDLSYARTFYKYRSVKLYLNGIAQILFNDLYRNQSINLSAFFRFWKTDLPLQIHDARKEFRISFLVFLIAFGIGILSSIYDKEFARIILGDDYVKMTIENIHKNDPLAVYKKANEAEMFMGITLNNLIVALSTFALGVFMSVGTLLALIRNGVMVGVFQYFFIERGLFKESFLTIWQHGTIEISCIIIAGAAGLTLGKGLIFPGTYTRMQSFKISAMRGLKIFLGISPLIVLAAFIEGFITRHTNINDATRIAVILISLLFILFYFVWYPWSLSRKKISTGRKSEKLNFREVWKYDFTKILKAEEILGYTFRYFSQNILMVLGCTIGIALFHASGTVLYEMNSDGAEMIAKHSFDAFFVMKSIEVHFWTGILTLSFLQCLLTLKIHQHLNTTLVNNKITTAKGLIYLISGSILCAVLILIPFYFGLFWGILSLIFFSPYLFISLYQSYQQQVFIFRSFSSSYALMDKSWSKSIWNSIKLFGFMLVLYTLINSTVAWQMMEVIYMNFRSGNETQYMVEMFLLTTSIIFLFGIFFFFQIITSIFSSYAFKETVYAENLFQKIEKFGERNSLFGFEKEMR
jgi:uncharacterized membrane protein SpoIIM required for sporulation